jgi:peptidoglycan/xylan/chitin deacetylase (PgdA/CDA1 family)
MSNIPVLMYHALEDNDHPAGANSLGEQLYVLQASRFREQMEYLHREGFRTFLLDELLDTEVWPEKGVVLTFDDGHESNYTLALPILQCFGFKAEFFVTTGWTDTSHFMNRDQIKALHSAGMSIGSHGKCHDFLDEMTDQEIEQELQESMETLTRITGQQVTSFSAPGGRIKSVVGKIADKLGYRIICTSRPGSFSRGISAHSVPRFALRQDTDLATFGNIVKLDSVYLYKLKNRNKLLSLAKKVLGNGLYESGRNLFLDSAKK